MPECVGDPIHTICLVVDKSRNAVALKLGGAFTEKAAPQKEPAHAAATGTNYKV